VATRLYVMPISNAAAAGAAMMAHKRIPHRLVRLMPGLHPLLVRFAGFEDFTVPALELEGHKLQGSRRIARFLDEVRPEPPLFPAEPELRALVEEAERWGEEVLQPVPRRLFRHLLLTSSSARQWMGTEIMHMPAAHVLVVFFMPVIRRLAQISRADAPRVRQDVAELPDLLDHVDALIAAGTIGRAKPNAADFQILASVSVLRAFADLEHHVRGRPCDAAARRLYPDWPPIPGGLPTSPVAAA
jgi:glutathione S-transferase